MKANNIACFVSFVFLFLLVSSCIQTKTLPSEPDEDVSRIKAPIYCGTFSSYISYGKNNQITYNDSVTQLSNLIFDSIVRTAFHKLPRLEHPFVKDTTDARLMSTDFVNIINQAVKHESIKNYRVNEVFYRLTEHYNDERFLFLIPTGYTRTALHLLESNKKRQDSKSSLQIIGEGIALASLSTTGNINRVYFPTKQRIHAQGSNCYVLIYNKSKREMTFYRQQFFIGKNIYLMQRKYLKKRAEYLLKEYL